VGNLLVNCTIPVCSPIKITSLFYHAASGGKKNLLNSNISPTCPYNLVNFGPIGYAPASGTPSGKSAGGGVPLLGDASVNHQIDGKAENRCGILTS